MKVKKSWWLLFLVSVGVMIPFVYPYVTLDPSHSRIPITSSAVQYPLLVAHIFTACVALVTGFLQFIDHLRQKSPKVHRYLGRVYVGSVFLSGILALGVTFYAENFTKAIAFLVLSLLWLCTAWKGYRTAVRKNFAEHRKWMIRSFGITLVAISGRIVMPFLLLVYSALHGFSLPGGMEKMVEEALNVNIWVGLVLNFIIVEWGMLSSKK